MTTLSRRGLLAGSAAVLVAATRGESAALQAQDRTDPPFGLGTVTYNVPQNWDLPTLLKILQQAGMRSVEFRTTHAHGVEPTLSPAQRAEVRQRCADAGIKQISLGTILEFQSPDPNVVQKNLDGCREWVQLAKDLGALGVKVRPNGFPKDVPQDRVLEQIGKNLRKCGEYAADAGVEIWVEVHGSGTQEPANFLKIMEHCGHKSVGANWNSNPTDVKDGSIREFFVAIRPKLMSAHINNLWGPYPYRELFRLMRETGYDRYTNCEVGNSVKPEDGLLFFQCYHGLWRELARA